MITLQDAIERAKLAADEGGILSQSFYNMLVNQVDETDVHPLTLALVENGLMVRTGSLTREKIEARRKALYWDVDEDADTYEEGVEEPTDPFVDDEVVELRKILEGAGIAVSSDGTVSFYKANIPGVYTERLPQSLPLSVATDLWEQKLEMVDTEKARVKNIQDALSRLKSQVDERIRTNKSPKISDIEKSLQKLEEYGFDPRSRSEVTQNISKAIEGVFETIMSNNWRGALGAIDEVQGALDEYAGNQESNYENDLYVWDALDRLSSLQESNPDAFNKAVSNLGGLAARLHAAFMREAQEAETTLKFYWNKDEFKSFVEKLSKEVGLSFEELYEPLVDNDYEWVRDATAEAASEHVVPADYIEIDFTTSYSHGLFEDDSGPIYSDSWEGGPIQKETDDVDDLIEVLEGYITKMVREDVKQGLFEE